MIRLLPLEILTALGFTESFSGLWAELVVPVIDRRVERYAIEHGVLCAFAQASLMAKSPIKRCETCGFFYSIHRRGFRGVDPRGFLVTAVYIRPFEPGELLPTEH